MRTFLRNTRRGWMQFNEADKGGAAGGTAAATEPKKEEGKEEEQPAAPPNPPADPAPAKTEATKPNVFSRAAAMLKDKSELLGTISAHEATIASLTGEKTNLTSQLSAVTAERDELKAGAADLETTIASLTKEKTTVSKAAADQVAALGFSQDKLPAAHSAETKSGEELYTQWQSLKADNSKSKEATTFFRKHKAEIQAYAATQKDK
jgi:chromosome segregation ATPase